MARSQTCADIKDPFQLDEVYYGYKGKESHPSVERGQGSHLFFSAGDIGGELVHFLMGGATTTATSSFLPIT